MTWQGVGVITAICGLIITIVLNAVLLAFFFGKLGEKVDSWTKLFARFEKMVEEHIKNNGAELKLLWARQDDLRDRVTKVETREQVNHREDHHG